VSWREVTRSTTFDPVGHSHKADRQFAELMKPQSR
jgi:hypothetical protein